MRSTSTKFKIISMTALWLFTFLSIGGAYFTTKVKTNYSMNQFFPEKHPLFTADENSRKVFHILDTAPHILLLSLPKGQPGRWYQSANLEKLRKLTAKISKVKDVKSVISLGNIQSAFEKNNELLVSNLSELQKAGFDTKQIVKNPLYAPNLISKDGRYSAIFVIPDNVSQDQHRQLSKKVVSLAKKDFPNIQIQIGGPAAIRTQFIDLLSHEIMIFILLSLACAIIVVKIMFHGFGIIPQMLFILTVVNTLALGIMGALGMSLNVLSSTLPIIVTITALGIATHTLVRMGEGAHLGFLARMEVLKSLFRELTLAHMLTAITTSVGFATLMSSAVPLLSDYGKVVAIGVLISAISTLILVASLYTWVKWPKPRNFLHDSSRFSFLIIRHARWVTPAIGVTMLAFTIIGTQLSWTAKLFDDLPLNHSASRTTALISKKLGGVASVDFIVGSKDIKGSWKKPQNLQAINTVVSEWRSDRRIGAIVTLADFMTTGEGRKKQIPKSKEAIAELQFLYSMSGNSPLKQFLSNDEKWTRISVRLPDTPANESKILIENMKNQLNAKFPGMEVKATGVGVTIPVVNSDISHELMWGFFESLFWIVLVLAVAFQSLRWALIAVLPNLVPPALLLGFLAIFNIPIKPGIAIIFSISLGIAFCNTVYVLQRLKEMIKSASRSKTLPIYSLMKKETMPCLVSSLSLFGGFSIFLFSAFPVNKMFGLFMLISIAAGLLGDLVWLPSLLRRFPWLLLDKKARTSPTGFATKWQIAARVAPYTILLVLGLVAFRTSYAAEDIKNILHNIEQRSSPPNERVTLKMVTQDSDGSKKTRELTIMRKNKGESRAMIRIHAPADLKGVGLLTISKGSSEDQYLYLPSAKKSRRILGSNKRGKFLDSEIGFEDLAISTYKEFDNKILKSSAKVVELESKAKSDSESSYGKILTWVSMPEYKIEKVEYFDKSGKLLKRAKFSSYQKIDKKYWRARNVLVENVQDKRTTRLMVKRVSLNEISDDEVSLDALEE